ncbi:arylsulfotransferase family protein [Roseibium salinum]|uniref:Aryl-sulfate sulfotransferase n=1 Tax=Roseibium salinum TaxID=1604349 RepID=A0ABT3QWN7_9HYPH|nr:arylsulfotransferase family protein [Roseibium sp. DSM 29163]MCX2721312.1 aryl-sulfate sulfotransferase [Roseibium sp. DSM 29163]
MMEKIGSAVFVLMVMFLAFVAGAMVMLEKTFPHDLFRDAYRAWEAVKLQDEITSDPVRANLYQPARTDGRGVTRYDEAKAFPGYTLFTSGDDQVARLVDMDGNVVHEWRLPFSQVWNEQAAVKQPQADSIIYMDRARVFPNGDLLAMYISSADTPWGYGMVKMDKDSRPIWSYLEHTHHDMSVAPDGRIYALTHAFNFERPPGAQQLDRPYLEDFLVVLSPDGKEQKKISLTQAMLHSRYGALFEILPYFTLNDPLHPNTVEYIDAEKAKNFPYGQEGDVVLSFREPNLIAVLSPETGEITWAARGVWLRQHNPSILANGNILLFDNLGVLRRGNSSRVLEIDPRTLDVAWDYTGTKEEPLHSVIRSNAQRLPNGNTLITESDGGRLLEVTRNGDIAWEYVNPLRRGDRDQLIPILNGAQRIDPAIFTPEFRETLGQPAS